MVKKPSRDHESLAEMALYMTHRFIRPRTNTVLIMEKCKFCAIHRRDFHSRLLEHFLVNFKAMMRIQLYVGVTDDRPWEYNIFIVDTNEAFEELRFNFPRSLHERDFYFFIVLTTIYQERWLLDSTVYKIFDACRRFHVLNAVILNPNVDGSYAFYTYKLYGPTKCLELLRVKEINRCDANGSLRYDFLFPENIIEDFNNCTLRVSAHVLRPLLDFEGDRKNRSHTKDSFRLRGIEGILLWALAGTLNFRIELSFPEEYTHVYSDGNATGCLGELQSGSADLAIGGFSVADPNRNFFSVSTTYYQSPFVFVVRRDLHFGPIKHLSYPFNENVWSMIGLTLLVAMAVIGAVNAYGKHHVRDFIIGPRNINPTTNLITIFLGNPVTKMPKKNFARFLLMSWMLITLVLRSAYQGKLFDSLRISRRMPIPTSIAGLIQNGYILISPMTVDYYPANLTRRMRNLTGRYLVVNKSSDRLTTIALLDNLAYYNAEFWNESSLTYVNEPVFSYQLAMYFHAGIVARLSAIYVHRKFQNLNDNIKIVPTISNSKLTGLYIVYYMLVVIAGSVFICERMSLKYKRIKRILDWIHRV